jgi:putative hydrolase of the HAD superfamily
MHVSFDAWNTLIVPNRTFAEARNLVIAALSNTSYEDAKARYTAIKTRVDAGAERGEPAPSSISLYRELIDDDLIAHQAMLRCQQLFVQHPPTMPDNVVDVLMMLKRRGITCSVTSNTNFVTGQLLFPMLQNMSYNAFTFGVFSDVIGHSKPSVEIFDRLVVSVVKIHGVHPEEAKAIIRHVGDNNVCDVLGARNYGIESSLVTADTMDMSNVLFGDTPHE